MKEYIRESLHQLFLIYFQPSQFQSEMEERFGKESRRTGHERFHYLIKMVPWIVVLAIIGNLIAGRICQQYGVYYVWLESWGGVFLGIVLGMLLGYAVSVLNSVAVGVVGGLLVGVERGITLGEAVDVSISVLFGILVGMFFGLLVGVRRGTSFGVLVGVFFGIVAGIAGIITFGIAYGALVGITGMAAVWVAYFRLYTYPFNVCLAVCAWLLRGQSKLGVHRAWHLCPLYWNEVIWLPLPYVTRLLVLLAQEDRVEGLRQIAFVAAERPLQRRVATVALQQIALDDLKANTLPVLETVGERLQWTADAPLALPEEFKAALPRFEQAARYVGQYRTLHNAYRKGEALERAVKEIEGVQTTLIGTRGRFAPRLLQTANAWRELLEREQMVLQSQIEAVREIPNPFVFGNPVAEAQENVFSGRQDIVQQIEACILGSEVPPTLLLHGSRRMGKTSILKQLPRLLGSEFAPAVMDCQNPAVTESAATLLRYLSRTISRGLERRRVKIEPLTAESLSQEPFAAFDDWLDAVEKAMPPKMRVLLCLDEYERLQETLYEGWGTRFLDTLRHTLQHRPRLVLMFSGMRSFAELSPAWTDRFISARRVRVSFLTPDEIRPLLTAPIPEFDMTYAEGALEAVLASTNGQPFLTQAVAYELVEYLNRQQRKEATCADVEAAIASALVRGGEYFANVWSDASTRGQAILQAIARDEPPPDYPQARLWLRNHDVLNDAGRFAVPMVERWVREYA